MKLKIDINKPTIYFPKYWAKCVGGGHAALGLRTDYQTHLKKFREDFGTEYIRFHGILCDDMQVVRKPIYFPLPGLKKELEKRISYSFYHIDQLYDFLVEIGMKPIVELSFMPSLLASGKRTVFYYKGNITPPKDYNKWNDLIRTLVEHFLDRYGLEEVKTWYFEVWNEPDLSGFWAGNQMDYFRLYENTAKTIKAVNAELKVGGPATSQNRWIPELREFCRKNNAPLDFLSTHHYPMDVLARYSGKFARLKMIFRIYKLIKKVLKEHPNLTEFDLMADDEYKKAAFSWENRGILTEQVKQARKESGILPLFYTEWGVLFKLDEIFEVPYMIKTIVDNQGIVDIYSMWTFSDEFEEWGFKTKPFNNAFGMLTIHGIPKPRYWGYILLNQLGEERLDISTTIEGSRSVEFIITKSSGIQEYQILLYNQHPYDEHIQEFVDLEIEGLPEFRNATIQRIDDNHGNPLQYWQEMGEPRYLNKSQVKAIMEQSKVVEEKFSFSQDNDTLSIKLDLPANGVALIKLNYA